MDLINVAIWVTNMKMIENLDLKKVETTFRKHVWNWFLGDNETFVVSCGILNTTPKLQNLMQNEYANDWCTI